jgi:hypothetical protein
MIASFLFIKQPLGTFEKALAEPSQTVSAKLLSASVGGGGNCRAKATTADYSFGFQQGQALQSFVRR